MKDNRLKIKVTEDNGAVILYGPSLLANAQARKVAQQVANKFDLRVSFNEHTARILGAETWEVAHEARMMINNTTGYVVA